MGVPRAGPPAILLTATLLTAGCLGAAPPGSPGSEGGSLAAAMLAEPPGSRTQPTGRTVDFTLYLHPMTHALYPGANMTMWGFSLSDDPSTAQVPGPELRVREGDLVRVRFLSTVPGFDHTIHWHGVHVPWRQDGVPYVSQDPIPPGEEFTYQFAAKPSGTMWYHCHVDTQHHVDMGMYGALIIEPRDPAQDPPFDAEHTLILDEMDRFHLESGQPAAGNAPQSGDPFDYEAWARRQAQDVVGRNPAVQDRVTGTPARPARDWYPVTYAPYHVAPNTYLINGNAFPYTQPVFVAEGQVVRLRLINAGDMVHALHLHGHHVLVTHKDGILLRSPWWADTVLIGPGERYDVYLKADNPGIWDLHDHVGPSVQNDAIHPGGMMTLLVYESHRDQVPEGHRHADGHDRGAGHGPAGGNAAGLDPRRHSGAYLAR